MYNLYLNRTEEYLTNASALLKLEPNLMTFNLSSIMEQLSPEINILHVPFEHATCQSNLSMHPNCTSCLKTFSVEGKCDEVFFLTSCFATLNSFHFLPSSSNF